MVDLLDSFGVNNNVTFNILFLLDDADIGVYASSDFEKYVRQGRLSLTFKEVVTRSCHIKKKINTFIINSQLYLITCDIY